MIDYIFCFFYFVVVCFVNDEMIEEIVVDVFVVVGMGVRISKG